MISAAHRTLGVLGEVGPLAFGHWRFVGHPIERAIELMERALDLGMNLIDTADIYGFGHPDGFGASEALLGEVLKRRPEMRRRIVLATKGGIAPGVPYNSSEHYLQKACDASLERLGVDQIDLYQIHRPDLYTSPAEVAAALDGLVDAGKVRAIGVSNYPQHMTEALAAFLRTPLTTIQPEFSASTLFPIRSGILDQAMRMGMTPLAWSPLAGGRLATGEGMRTDLIRVIDSIAGREGCDRAAVALAFVLAHPARPVAIVGSQNVERLDSAVRALTVQVNRADLYKIIEASEGVPLP